MKAEIPNIHQRHDSVNDMRSSSNVNGTDGPRLEHGRSLSSSSLATRFVEANDTGLDLSSSSLRIPGARSLEAVQNLEVVNGSEAVGQAALPTNTNSNGTDFRANRLAAVYVPGYPLGPVGSPSTISPSPSLPILDYSYPLYDSQVSSTSSNLSPVSEIPADQLLNNPLTSSTRFDDNNPNAASSGASSSLLYERIPEENQIEPVITNSTRPESLNCFYEEFADSVVEDANQSILQPVNNEERDETARVEENVQEVQDEMDVEIVEAEEQAVEPRVEVKRHATRSRGEVDVETEPVSQPRTARENRSNLKTRDGRVTRHHFTCGVCGEGYHKRTQLLRHMGVSHLVAMSKETQGIEGTTLIKCSVCQRTFKGRFGLASHLRTHVIRVAPGTRS